MYPFVEATEKTGWLNARECKFSARSAYDLANGWAREGAWGGWKLIWNLNVLQMVKEFLWILARKKNLLINCSKWRRRLTHCPDCERFNGAREDIMHAIRDCNIFRKLRVHLVPT